MPQFIDAHFHLTHLRFEGQREAVVQRAREAGLWRAITVGSNAQDTKAAFHWYREYPDFIRVVAGIDPYHAGIEDIEKEFEFFNQRAPELAAIGEVGMDATYPVSLNKQERVFEAQVALATEHGLTVVVHCRGAEERMLHIMETAEVPWVWHFFYKAKFLKAALDAGAVLSLPSLKSRDLDRVYENAPLERVLCETDAPAAKSEGPNEPGSVVFGYQRLADNKEITVDEAASVIARTAKGLFKGL